VMSKCGHPGLDGQHRVCSRHISGRTPNGCRRRRSMPVASLCLAACLARLGTRLGQLSLDAPACAAAEACTHARTHARAETRRPCTRSHSRCAPSRAPAGAARHREIVFFVLRPVRSFAGAESSVAVELARRARARSSHHVASSIRCEKGGQAELSAPARWREM